MHSQTPCRPVLREGPAACGGGVSACAAHAALCANSLHVYNLPLVEDARAVGLGRGVVRRPVIHDAALPGVGALCARIGQSVSGKAHAGTADGTHRVVEAAVSIAPEKVF